MKKSWRCPECGAHGEVCLPRGSDPALVTELVNDAHAGASPECPLGVQGAITGHAPGCRYYVDDFGRLWSGPQRVEGTLRYATFEGFTGADGSEVWVLRRSDADPAWCEIPLEKAAEAAARFLTE